MEPLRRVIALAAAAALSSGAHAAGCDVPDEDGMHWRRAVSRVKNLPETEAWAELMSRERSIVQYVLALDEPTIIDGRCYWPLEVRADGKPWKRFLVAPVGGRVIEMKKR